MTTIKKQLSVMIIITMLLPSLVAADSVYETRAEFIARAYHGSSPDPRIAWLSGERKLMVQEILGHDYPALRLRYWCEAGRSAWILDEVGKELPITVGVIIDNDHIENLRVLTYRENRGGEVVTPAFTDQFYGVALEASGALGATIDGISGATLSVQALTRLANMALFLHESTGCEDGA